MSVMPETCAVCFAECLPSSDGLCANCWRDGELERLRRIEEAAREYVKADVELAGARTRNLTAAPTKETLTHERRCEERVIEAQYELARLLAGDRTAAA